MNKTFDFYVYPTITEAKTTGFGSPIYGLVCIAGDPYGHEFSATVENDKVVDLVVYCTHNSTTRENAATAPLFAYAKSLAEKVVRGECELNPQRWVCRRTPKGNLTRVTRPDEYPI